MEYRLSRHARQAMEARDITWAEVVEVLKHPEVTYSQWHNGHQQTMHQRGDLAVPVAADGTILTVLLRSAEQWTDDDAKGRKR